MTYDDDLTLRVGEPYFHFRELSKNERDALVALSGIPPYRDDEEEDGIEVGVEPEQQLLQYFLENAMQYAAREAFDPDDGEAFANLASFAEYLLDAMSLMAKVDESELEEMILAALMAKVTLDEAIYHGLPSRTVWDAMVSRARVLHDRCVKRAANAN